MANNEHKPEIKENLETIINLRTLEIVRDYLLGYKKNGKPRAVYDVVKDRLKPNGGKKGYKREKADKFSLYIEPSRKKGKKKKAKKKKTHWEY